MPYPVTIATQVGGPLWFFLSSSSRLGRPAASITGSKRNAISYRFTWQCAGIARWEPPLSGHESSNRNTGLAGSTVREDDGALIIHIRIIETAPTGPFFIGPDEPWCPAGY